MEALKMVPEVSNPNPQSANRGLCGMPSRGRGSSRIPDAQRECIPLMNPEPKSPTAGGVAAGHAGGRAGIPLGIRRHNPGGVWRTESDSRRSEPEPRIP